MGASPHCRMHKEIWGSPSVRWCIAMFAAASVIEALLASALEMTDTSSSQRHAASVAMPQDEHERLHPLTPGDLVVGHSLSRFGPWIIRVQQKKWQGPHLRAVTVGLVAVVCLAVAFVVLQCAQKALMSTKLFGSVGKRALSGSELEAQWVEACAEMEEEEEEGEEEEEEEEEKGEEKAGGARAREEEDTSEETGESEALRVLDELRSIMVLGLETVPHLPCDKKTALVVLLSTICTQEIAVYGVYSTPRVEQERIKTIDILLNLGRQAFAQLHADGESFQKVSRGAEMLDLLERFRIPEPVQIPGGLTAEASISLFRISHCKEALEQLQRWVKRSVTVPKDVSERALKILSYTRHETKQRLKADANTKSYVDEKQIQLRFYGIIEPSQKRSAAYPKSIEREMRRLGRGYGRLQRLFVRNIKSALSQQPVQLSLQEHRQQWAQQQQQELQPLQQQHHSTSQPAENTAVATQPGEQLAMLRSGVGVPPPLPSSPLPAPCQGALPTPTPTFLNSPVPQSSQPPRKDSRQHIPTAPPELPDQLPAHSAPTSQVTQQESRKQQQSSFSSSTSMSGFRAEAPVFRPRGIPQEEAQWDTSNTYPGTVHASWTAPPAPGFASPWQTAGPSTSMQSQQRRPPMPAYSQAGYLQTMPPGHPSSHISPTPHHHQPRPPHPFPRHFTGPGQPHRTISSPARFPSHAFQHPTSETPRHVQAPPPLFSGGSRQMPASRFASPTMFWPPKDRNSLEGTYPHSPVHTWDFNPVLGLIADAFPGEGTHWPNEPERIDQWEARWLQDPSSQSLPPSGENQEIPPLVDVSLEVPSGSQGASAAFGGTPQTQEGPAWSLWGDYGGNSRQ